MELFELTFAMGPNVKNYTLSVILNETDTDAEDTDFFMCFLKMTLIAQLLMFSEEISQHFAMIVVLTVA